MRTRWTCGRYDWTSCRPWPRPWPFRHGTVVSARGERPLVRSAKYCDPPIWIDCVFTVQTADRWRGESSRLPVLVSEPPRRPAPRRVPSLAVIIDWKSLAVALFMRAAGLCPCVLLVEHRLLVRVRSLCADTSFLVSVAAARRVEPVGGDRYRTCTAACDRQTRWISAEVISDVDFRSVGVSSYYGLGLAALCVVGRRRAAGQRGGAANRADGFCRSLSVLQAAGLPSMEVGLYERRTIMARSGRVGVGTRCTQ